MSSQKEVFFALQYFFLPSASPLGLRPPKSGRPAPNSPISFLRAVRTVNENAASQRWVTADIPFVQRCPGSGPRALAAVPLDDLDHLVAQDREAVRHPPAPRTADAQNDKNVVSSTEATKVEGATSSSNTTRHFEM